MLASSPQAHINAVMAHNTALHNDSNGNYSNKHKETSTGNIDHINMVYLMHAHIRNTSTCHLEILCGVYQLSDIYHSVSNVIWVNAQ